MIEPHRHPDAGRTTVPAREGAGSPPGRWSLALTATLAGLCFGGCGRGGGGGGPRPEQAVADAVFDVLSADRETYAEDVVHRLQNVEKVLKAGEHWKDEKLLPLPAQMFRLGAERARKRSSGLSYALLSLWPINKQNSPRTEVERAGLQAVRERPDDRFYGEEELAGVRYFTAVYPDKAVSQACVTCHNGHSESPRTDFKPGDVMGGIVIRVAIR